MSRGEKSKGRAAELSASHRHIVSALLRGFEDMCAEIERWVDPPEGVLVAVEERLNGDEQRRLRGVLGRLREELTRLQREFALDVSSRSARRSIDALLVEHLSLLEETASEELRGYGEMEEGTRRRLGEEFARVHRVFEEMLGVVRRKPAGG